MFDNFSSQDTCADRISEFVAKYKNNRRVFTIAQTPTSILENRIADEVEDDSAHYKRVFMQYLSKNDIRRMAINLSHCTPSDITLFTNRIISCFSKTCLPRTPFAVSLVVAVCNISSDYEPVNLAAVIKRFMEIVLDRLSPKDLLSNEYGFGR